MMFTARGEFEEGSSRKVPRSFYCARYWEERQAALGFFQDQGIWEVTGASLFRSARRGRPFDFPLEVTSPRLNGLERFLLIGI
jgi:hypothetical protein